MATVYKALDPRLDRAVALKVIRMERDSSGDFLKRFDREAKALAKLSHPNIVHVNEFGEFEGIPYLVMDYISNGTLKQRMGKPIPWADAVKFLLPIANALDYAHKHNVIHRDVKPANILITETGAPMLSDFGLAKILEGGFAGDLSGSGVAGIGTPEYMAPEQVLGKPVDGRADMYALAIVLYEMITGCIPFKADTPIAIGFKQCYDPVPDPKTWAGEIPAGVEHVLIKALAKEPERRFADMTAFSKALQELLATGGKYKVSNQGTQAESLAGISVKPTAKPEPVKKKHRELAITLAILLPIIGTIAGIFLLGSMGVIAFPPRLRAVLTGLRNGAALTQNSPVQTLTVGAPIVIPSQSLDATPRPGLVLKTTCSLAGINSPTFETNFATGQGDFSNTLWSDKFFSSSGQGQVDFNQPGVLLQSNELSTSFLGIKSDAPNSVFSIRLMNKGIYQLVLVDPNYDGTWVGSKKNMALKVGLNVDNSDPAKAASIIILMRMEPPKAFVSFPLVEGQFITIVVDWVKGYFEIFDQDNHSINRIPLQSLDLNGTWWLIGDPWSDGLANTDLFIGQICFQSQP